MIDIKEYASVIGQNELDELFLLAKKFEGKTLQNINSTAVGGGVAEILTHMIPLLKQLGINARWDVIKGNERFFVITKNMHNALHGVKVDISQDDFEYFLEVNRMNAAEMDFSGDFIFVHDPQPIGLIEKRKEVGKHWAWRGHVDFSKPYLQTWDFLAQYINKYDAAVFSAPSFSRELEIPQVLIAPSIDPLANKNKELPEETINEVFSRFQIDRSRPVITQISRFDYLKDPVGVIKAYKKVKKYVDAQLVLAGGGATDDPEGAKVMEEVRIEADKDKDIFVLFLPPASDIEINALQRGSTILLQKSLKEGFGLTVSEALWKSKPVIASAVGGIPLQIAHKYSGILTHTIDGTAYWMKQLINEPGYAKQLGVNGKEHIKNNFLITRHIKDYLLLFLSLFNPGDVVHL
ncbi:MAG TPA: glycosyltransferase [Bacteroidota bacterium]|jgi:trehalose synthase|nr:glycosyltransferase [Bacteroidota bacterium]